MDRPIKPVANLCFEISRWEESFGVWAVVGVWRGRIRVESQDEVEIGGGDDTDGMGVFRYGDREGRLDDGSIEYGCHRALILVAGGALWAMSWVEVCICILKTSYKGRELGL